MSEYSINQGTGELENYPDPYKEVTQTNAERAYELETQILQFAGQIEVHYLRLAQALTYFKNEELYKARGYPTFQAWADSPELKAIGYRSAQRLVQIVEKALPILDKHGVMEAIPPISTMGDLLPILRDENGEQKFVDALHEVEGLTNKDAKARIKEIRGIAVPNPSDPSPVMFSAKVTKKDEYFYVKIYASDGVDYYEVTSSPLRIRPKHWPRFEDRFGYLVDFSDE